MNTYSVDGSLLKQFTYLLVVLWGMASCGVNFAVVRRNVKDSEHHFGDKRSNDRVNDTLNLCHKLIFAQVLALGGRFDR